MLTDATDLVARSLCNFFVWTDLDRATDRRTDDAHFRELVVDPASGLVPFWGDQCLVTGESDIRPVVLPAGAVTDGIVDPETITLLGFQDRAPRFTGSLTADLATVASISPCRAADLRSISPQLRPADAALLGYAKAMLHWHHCHRFCGVCGAPTRSHRAGHVRICSGSGCEQWHFPRTDPAIIVAVTREEHCLLGRQASWPPKRYSVIAGFVEPGESVEQAAVREIREETGLRAEQLRYHSSQPWPFPGSLMLGYTASTRDVTIVRHDGELQDAGWYSRNDIRRGLRDGDLRLPPAISIAFRLVEDWFNLDGSRLSDYVIVAKR